MNGFAFAGPTGASEQLASFYQIEDDLWVGLFPIGDELRRRCPIAHTERTWEFTFLSTCAVHPSRQLIKVLRTCRSNGRYSRF